MDSVGQRIKKRRKELGISAEELAKRLNKNRATIYRYESDEIENMPTTVLEPLSKALLTTPAYLMGWDEKQVFPANLKILMQNKNISEDVLSSETNISITRIEQFLNHTDDPSHQEAEILASYFDTNTKNLLTGDVNNISLTDDKTIKMLTLISQLNDNGKDKVTEYIKDLSDKYFKR